MNSVKEIDLKIRTHNDMINIKKLDQNKNKIDEKSCKNIFTYYISYKKAYFYSSLYTLLSIKQMDTLKKVMKISIWH